MPHRRHHRRPRRRHRPRVLHHGGLLEAHKLAQQKGQDTKLILCLPATFAEDVKAIEVATGVLSTEGGYSAHASVVARQYGKVSLVKPDMKITRQPGHDRGPRHQGRRLRHAECPLLRRAVDVPRQGRAHRAGSRGIRDAGLPRPRGEVRQAFPCPGQRRQAAGCGPGAQVRGTGHRTGAHGAHVLRREADQRVPGDGPLRLRGGAAKALRQAAADAEGGLLQALQDHGRLPRHHPASGRAAARVPAAQRRGDGAVHAVSERRQEGSRAGRGEGRAGPQRGPARVQPHARPPRLPHRRLLSRDLRDAGPGHLRGRLHPARRKA